MAWAYCAGTDTVNSARGFMFALGCIQCKRCCSTHLNPLGAFRRRSGFQQRRRVWRRLLPRAGVHRCVPP
ncbi:MAG: FMN-binding glutamate synthase family protein, partial [Rhodomicrobium sp.]